jgi:hypothetical protein
MESLLVRDKNKIELLKIRKITDWIKQDAVPGQSPNAIHGKPFTRTVPVR